MKEISSVEDIDKAQQAIKAFEVDYGAKHPKAVAKIVDAGRHVIEVLPVSRSIGYTFAPLTLSKVLLPQYV
jgi:hypothetical protein